MPPWARQLERDMHKLRQDHEALKSKQAADTMATVHLLSDIAKEVGKVSVDVANVHKQIWGAIKEIRKGKR